MARRYALLLGVSAFANADYVMSTAYTDTQCKGPRLQVNALFGGCAEYFLPGVWVRTSCPNATSYTLALFNDAACTSSMGNVTHLITTACTELPPAPLAAATAALRSVSPAAFTPLFTTECATGTYAPPPPSAHYLTQITYPGGVCGDPRSPDFTGMASITRMRTCVSSGNISVVFACNATHAISSAWDGSTACAGDADEHFSLPLGCGVNAPNPNAVFVSC